MKNNEKLLDIIGEVDEQLIPEPAKKKPNKAKWFAVGGGVCAAALVGAIALHGIGRPDIPTSTSEVTAEVTSTAQESAEPITEQTTTAPPDEPVVTEEPPDDPVVTDDVLPAISDEEYAEILENHRIYPEYELPQQTDDGLVHIPAQFESGAMGFGGLWMFDISEYDTPNPWSEELQLSTLPVFRNLSYTELGGISLYLTEEQMLDMAENVAASLGQTVESTKSEKLSDIMSRPPVEYVDSMHLVYRVVVDCGEVTIDVYGDGEIKVELKEPVRLPEGYSYTYHDTSDEQAEKTIAYLADRLRGLLQYDKPVSYSNNDRDIYQRQGRRYYVYDSSDDIIQDILNYNLKFAWISPNDDGELWMIRMCDALACSEYLGDYPIITEDEARALLLDGCYISASAQEKIEESDIVKVELVYRMGDEYIQPYYRYYVDTTYSSMLDAERMGDMNEYSMFHVPAVKAEYLSDFTLWDGSIN